MNPILEKLLDEHQMPVGSLPTGAVPTGGMVGAGGVSGTPDQDLMPGLKANTAALRLKRDDDEIFSVINTILNSGVR